MKVLVVEDEKKIASLVRKGLEAHGFLVESSQNGDEGFVLATSRFYDVVVLDIMLPGCDGFEVLELLKAGPDTRRTRVIILTAKGREVDRRRARELGVDDYITKPFANRDVVERVTALLRRPRQDLKAVSERDPVTRTGCDSTEA